MASERVQRFLDALKALEESNDVGPMAACFASDCEVGNVLVPHKFHGPDGATRFWTEYRGSFGEVRSEFRNIIESRDRAALEWVSRGTSANGEPFDYEGVSILEFDGDEIRRFHALFDPSRLGHQLEVAVGQEREVPAH
jgi:hypothetical protein